MKVSKAFKVAVPLGVFVITLATTVAAAGGGIPGQTPGGYKLDDVNAHASLGGATTPTIFSVEQGTYTFTPIGGPAHTSHATVVGLVEIGTTSSSSGCFMVPASSLTINSTLHTIRLRVTLMASQMIPQSPLPLALDLGGGVGKGGAQGVCGPTFGTLTFPIPVDVTWTPNTPATNLAKQAKYSCSNFTAQTSSQITTVGTSASSGVFSDPFSGTATEHVMMNVQGPGAYPAGCNLPTY
jgi:hypothetical protein